MDAELLLEAKEHEQVDNNAQPARSSKGETEDAKPKPTKHIDQKMDQAPSRANLTQALETQAQAVIAL